MPDPRTSRFDRLVIPHLEVLFRVAYRLARNTPDARDLVQDTCVAACEHPVDLDAAEHPRRWLLRVLHNRFIDNARRRKLEAVVTAEEADLNRTAKQASDPEELLQQADGERALEHAFLQLDEVQRTLLALRTEGYDLAEIEQITGINREVLRARLHRARRSLARHLNGQSGPKAGCVTGSEP